MKKNNSPWLHQLNRQREPVRIEKDEETDILIIGAGIAGVLTSYFILKNTKNKVLLIDCNLVGHGATGHNAGQLTTYFERPISDIALEFGVSLACEAQKDVESSWEILEDLQKETNLQTEIYIFTGYAGFTSLSQIMLHLTNNLIRHEGGINIPKILISDNFKHLKDIPSVYSYLYEITTHENILNLLETNNKDYIAVASNKKGVTNSAKISEELVNFMINKYGDRFKLFENTPANKIILEDERVNTEIVFDKKDTDEIDKSPDFKIFSKKAILCTNGFEGFKIENHAGENIDKKFHLEIYSRINYMSAYIDRVKENPTAISYFPKNSINSEEEDGVTGDTYFYITRRPYVHNGEEVGLISTGGPEGILKEEDVYNRESDFEDWAEKDIDDFLKNNYSKHPGEDVVYDYTWHGLLGYTSTGIRMIGEEPLNTNLIYNLGCNGIGIMPSIFGAEKISKILNKQKFKKSIFDPRLNNSENSF